MRSVVSLDLRGCQLSNKVLVEDETRLDCHGSSSNSQLWATEFEEWMHGDGNALLEDIIHHSLENLPREKTRIVEFLLHEDLRGSGSKDDVVEGNFALDGETRESHLHVSRDVDVHLADETLLAAFESLDGDESPELELDSAE